MRESVTPVTDSLGAQSIVGETVREVISEGLSQRHPPSAIFNIWQHGDRGVGITTQANRIPIVFYDQPPVHVAPGFDLLTQRSEHTAVDFVEDQRAKLF